MTIETTGVSEGIFEYSGIPVAYLKTGSGPPLLLLHGWGNCSDVLLPLARSLSDIRTCFIPDLPGFGKTPPPREPWSVGDYADLVRAFVHEFAGGSTDVLAHSFGGRIVLKWAARCATETGSENASKKRPQNGASDELLKIIITGGAGMKPRRSFSYYRRRTMAVLLKTPFLILPGALKSKALQWLRGTAIWRSLGSSDYQKLDGVMRETFVRTVSEHLEDCLPAITQEVLLLWGKEDESTPWYQAGRMAQGLVNGALVGIDRAGHYAFLDQPDRFRRIVRAFFVPEK